GLLLGRPASNHAHGIDPELPALLFRLALRGSNPLRGLFERGSRGLQEERVAIADGEGLADRRGPGIHDHRTCAAVRLRLALDALHAQVFSLKIEILLVRPDHFDDVDPFLRVFVTGLVIALLHTEHLELALVPANHDVQPEPAYADMVRGD